MALEIPERGELVARGVDVEPLDRRADKVAEKAREDVESDWAADRFPTGPKGSAARRELADRKTAIARRAVYLLALEECFR